MKKPLEQRLAESFLLAFGERGTFEVHIGSESLAGRVALALERQGCTVEWLPGSPRLVVNCPRSDLAAGFSWL